jgi:iron complex outermembrane receptor protein
LSIAASFWRIRIDDTISIPQGSQLLAAESAFADRIVRGDPSAADLAAGIPGPLELIDVTRMNFGSVDTSGVDLSVSRVLATDFGRFTPSFAVTWVRDFNTSDLIQGPDFTRVGVANLQGSVPRWRAVGGLGWNRSGFGASGTFRYVPSYDDVDAFGSRNGRRVGAQTLVDAQLSLNLGEMVTDGSPWDGIEIRVGLINALNAEPPFAEVDGLFGYDLSQGDLRQRYAYLKLTKKF